MSYIAENAIPLLIGASFTCGVVVFYLVMMRTLKHRQRQAEVQTEAQA